MSVRIVFRPLNLPGDTGTTRAILLRRGTAEEWERANPVLLYKEVGIETSTPAMKIGNGISNWIDLPYANGPEALDLLMGAVPD